MTGNTSMVNRDCINNAGRLSVRPRDKSGTIPLGGSLDREHLLHVVSRHTATTGAGEPLLVENSEPLVESRRYWPLCAFCPRIEVCLRC
ncbi:unnamed protein product [Boreogadus saida]